MSKEMNGSPTHGVQALACGADGSTGNRLKAELPAGSTGDRLKPELHALGGSILRYCSSLLICGGFAAALAFAGCRGIPAKDEKATREQAQHVAARFRPDGGKPALPSLTSNSPLADFLAVAALSQPRVEAAYFDWLASIERITTARSLPDPQITFQMDIQSIVTSVMPGLMQNFPGAGKRRAAAELATAESQAKYHAFEATVLESSFEVKRVYYQAYFLEEKIRLTRDTLTLLAELETLARVQNEVGKVTLQDVLRAQIEKGRLDADLANLEDSRAPLAAEFKAALGFAPGHPAPPFPSRFESTPLELTSRQLVDAAMDSNQSLKALEAEVHSAEAAIAAAAAGRNPDFSAGLMADVKMNPALYRPTGTMSLPIWRDKIAAQIAEARANQHAAQARLSNEQIRLAVDVAERSYAYQEATRNVTLFEQQLLPRQRQSLEVARSGYLAGQIDFFNLTDAEQTLLRFGFAELEARSQRELALAELSLLASGMTPSRSGSVTVDMSAPVPSRRTASSMNGMK